MKAIKTIIIVAVIIAIICGAIYMFVFMPKTDNIDTDAIVYNLQTDQIANVHIVMQGKTTAAPGKDKFFNGNIIVSGSGFDKSFKNIYITYPSADPMKSGFMVLDGKMVGTLRNSNVDKNQFYITFYPGVYEQGDDMNMLLCVGVDDKAGAVKLIEDAKNPNFR